jgi:hypothetical protein
MANDFKTFFYLEAINLPVNVNKIFEAIGFGIRRKDVLLKRSLSYNTSLGFPVSLIFNLKQEGV